ncbi:proline hydroxylase [Caulobacter vibrioides]|uniref:2OG-Fe(II) oxygenase family protein n=1 Tax=Caulobacter vibrioides TaxID=155892 RepID=UPI000BB4E2DB|nr:2OG-Fe(II) oxygenase family protein [Caulobacter vibrioides]ATC25727.1 proline hydroxylase [Caulobacter vibrioides]AZH13873.1 proline hydroxylase [Caulobacter vibrioides]PLR07645.1 proline hydroxylase [Caulobacter vibrioides]
MPQHPPLRINTDLPIEAFAERFAQDGYVQIPVFLAPQDAETVAALLEPLTWNIVAPDEASETLVITPEVIKKFGEAQVRQFLQGALKRAARGFSFVHMSYALQDEYLRAPQTPVHRATEFLESRAFLDFGGLVIGAPDVTGVRVQASYYRPGDFLTLHDDSHRQDHRLAAFTLGFTRRWRPDWGGQLLFHNAEGDVTRGFAPGFNVLTLFKVPTAHSVAQVASYAEAKRLSLTGWLLGDKNAA